MTAPRGVLLFPGAGSSSANPALVAICETVAPLACERADFPYRLAGRRAPDRPGVLLATVQTADSWQTMDDGVVKMLERLVKR